MYKVAIFELKFSFLCEKLGFFWVLEVKDFNFFLLGVVNSDLYALIWDIYV